MQLVILINILYMCVCARRDTERRLELVNLIGHSYNMGNFSGYLDGTKELSAWKHLYLLNSLLHSSFFCIMLCTALVHFPHLSGGEALLDGGTGTE